MKTNAEYQREHRARVAGRTRKLEQALRDVIQLTGDKQGESAVAIRAVCVEALG